MTGPGRSLHNIHYQTHAGGLQSSFHAVILIGMVGLLASSCTPARPPGEAPGASSPTGSPGPTGPSGPTAPAPPPATFPVSAVLMRLGELSAPLQTDGTEPVDPASAFEVRSPVAFQAARLVLLDSRDAMVPSVAEAEVGPSGSRFVLTPQEPLTPASRYVLRLEGLESRLVRSADGRTFEPMAVPFRVAGEPPAAPPRKAKKKRSR
jgi:hypothetical protein